MGSGARRIDSPGGRPTTSKRVVPASVVKEGETVVPAPDNHFNACPHCGVITPSIGRVGGADACPTVGAGIISSAGVMIDETISSAPDDHLTAAPHRGVLKSGCRRVGGAGGCPDISVWIVSCPSIKKGNRRRRRCRWRTGN